VESASIAVSQEKPDTGKWAVKITGYGTSKISQTFATVPGQLYQVNYRYAGGGVDSSFLVYWGGTKIYQRSKFDDSGYQVVSSVQVATGTTTTLEFVYDG